jgi:hypothetical protein
VAPLEMNEGTCWGKNTIDPRGRGVERPRKATLTLFFRVLTAVLLKVQVFCDVILFLGG